MAEGFSRYNENAEESIAVQELSRLNLAIAKRQFAIDIKETQDSVLQDLICEEDKKIFEETNSIEKIREYVAKNRKRLCDNVNIFNNEYGIRKIISNIRNEANKKRDDDDHNSYINNVGEVRSALEENKKLKNLLANTLAETEICKSKLSELTANINKLEKECNEGSEFLRLKSAIALSMQQTQELELEYQNLQGSDTHPIEIIEKSLEKVSSDKEKCFEIRRNCSQEIPRQLKSITATSSDFVFSQAWRNVPIKRIKTEDGELEPIICTDLDGGISKSFRSPTKLAACVSSNETRSISKDLIGKSKSFETDMQLSASTRSSQNIQTNNTKDTINKNKREKPIQEVIGRTQYRNANRFTYKTPKM